jgi:hypothetical protein
MLGSLQLNRVFTHVRTCLRKYRISIMIKKMLPKLVSVCPCFRGNMFGLTLTPETCEIKYPCSFLHTTIPNASKRLENNRNNAPSLTFIYWRTV